MNELITKESAERPSGFDYTKPDDPDYRCPRCNRNGFNRTGLILFGYVGATTTLGYGVPCTEKGCQKGVIYPPVMI